MNECYHNSWLTGWMYEGDMRLFCFWNHADTYQRGAMATDPDRTAQTPTGRHRSQPARTAQIPTKPRTAQIPTGTY